MLHLCDEMIEGTCPHLKGVSVDDLKPVVLDVEALVSRKRLAAYNDKTGKTITDYMEEAVDEALAVVGFRAEKPEVAEEAEAAPMLSATELAMNRAMRPAESEGVAK